MSINIRTPGVHHVTLRASDYEPARRFYIENTGVKLDETLGKQYVAFKDPDRIQWEFS